MYVYVSGHILCLCLRGLMHLGDGFCYVLSHLMCFHSLKTNTPSLSDPSFSLRNFLETDPVSHLTCCERTGHHSVYFFSFQFLPFSSGSRTALRHITVTDWIGGWIRMIILSLTYALTIVSHGCRK